MSLYMDPNGNFPRHPGDVRLADGCWKKGDPLPDGWRKVVQTPPPQVPGKVVKYGIPVEIDGVLTTTYELVDMKPKSLMGLSDDDIRKALGPEAYRAYQEHLESKLQ